MRAHRSDGSGGIDVARAAASKVAGSIIEDDIALAGFAEVIVRVCTAGTDGDGDDEGGDDEAGRLTVVITGSSMTM